MVPIRSIFSLEIWLSPLPLQLRILRATPLVCSTQLHCWWAISQRPCLGEVWGRPLSNEKTVEPQRVGGPAGAGLGDKKEKKKEEKKEKKKRERQKSASRAGKLFVHTESGPESCYYYISMLLDPSEEDWQGETVLNGSRVPAITKNAS